MNPSFAKVNYPLHANIPTLLTLGKSFKISQTYDQYITINTTALEDDLSQTTIPYIDAQEVVPNPPTVLTGIGLMYKATERSGGFIAPIIQPLDLSEIFKEKIVSGQTEVEENESREGRTIFH